MRYQCDSAPYGTTMYSVRFVSQQHMHFHVVHVGWHALFIFFSLSHSRFSLFTLWVVGPCFFIHFLVTLNKHPFFCLCHGCRIGVTAEKDGQSPHLCVFVDSGFVPLHSWSMLVAAPKNMQRTQSNNIPVYICFHQTAHTSFHMLSVPSINNEKLPAQQHQQQKPK